MNREVINGQLQHHWAGATGGVALFERVGRTHGDEAAAATVSRLAVEIGEDREALRAIMHAVGVEPSTLGAMTARAGEWVGRFKPNGRIVSRSPLSDVLELEALRIAVSGKRSGWQVLRELADREPRIDAGEMDRLLERADAQLETLRETHLRVALERVLEQS